MTTSAPRRFRNLDGSGPSSSRDVFRWMVLDRLARRRRRSAAHAEVPRIAVDRALLAPDALGVRLTWIGHASWLVQLDGASILIDPVFPERISGFLRRNVPAALQPNELPPIDATLVTHSHYDHLDVRSVRAARARVVAGAGMARVLPGCRELDWWETEPIRGEVRATFVPAQHWSRRGLRDVNRTLWGGFIVQGPSGTVYHAGDTALFSGFAQIGERFPGIDVAMLPIGAYDPPWFMERQHMNPEPAVQAFLDLGARTFAAMHWGTFKLTDEPLDEPPRRLRAEWQRRSLAAAALRIPAIGETIVSPGKPSNG
jgi:L-ascorbate metabolism protein UlaG (beta-lactamase superfamily)